jgi:predicted 3-demethylubiquinone-9 3-methyltransferase (glyoxalase superfamily)
MQTISPFLWFDTRAEEAAKFYTSVFKNSKILGDAKYPEGSPGPAGTVMTVEMLLEGQHFTALNGGPIFKLTPAISFFVHCESAEEVDALWNKFLPGGKVMMELKEYPYSKRYGWIQDKFGVTWQLMLTAEKQPQKIVPCLLFVNQKFGKAEEAINYYLSVFPNSSVITMNKAGDMPPYKEGMVMYAAFNLCGQMFTAMDGPGKHAFDFTEAISFVVNCDTQEEVDGFWSKLSAHKESEQCGWLKDKFGVSWQVVPTGMGKLMSSKDPAKSQRAMQAMLKMKKLDLKALQDAFDGK